MATTLATGDASAWTVDEQFLDLICGDADLLAIEFDAIIAAGWPTLPADGPGRGAANDHPGSGETRRVAGALCGPVSRPRHPGIGGWARQRSPPSQHPSRSTEKGR